MAEIKYTKFAGLINWSKIALGRKVYHVYLVVYTLLLTGGMF